MSRRDRGFTLIETVIAFAIVSISLATLSETFGLSLRRAHRTADESFALMHLESLIDRTGIESPLTEGTREGTLDSRFRWHIDAKSALSPEQQATALSVLMDVTATVSWTRDGVSHSIASHRLELAPRIPP
jgi:general secretion pathway protein I